MTPTHIATYAFYPFIRILSFHGSRYLFYVLIFKVLLSVIYIHIRRSSTA